MVIDIDDRQDCQRVSSKNYMMFSWFMRLLERRLFSVNLNVSLKILKPMSLMEFFSSCLLQYKNYYLLGYVFSRKSK